MSTSVHRVYACDVCGADKRVPMQFDAGAWGIGFKGGELPKGWASTSDSRHMCGECNPLNKKEPELATQPMLPRSMYK